MEQKGPIGKGTIPSGNSGSTQSYILTHSRPNRRNLWCGLTAGWRCEHAKVFVWTSLCAIYKLSFIHSFIVCVHAQLSCVVRLFTGNNYYSINVIACGGNNYAVRVTTSKGIALVCTGHSKMMYEISTE